MLSQVKVIIMKRSSSGEHAHDIMKSWGRSRTQNDTSGLVAVLQKLSLSMKRAWKGTLKNDIGYWIF